MGGKKKKSQNKNNQQNHKQIPNKKLNENRKTSKSEDMPLRKFSLSELTTESNTTSDCSLTENIDKASTNNEIATSSDDQQQCGKKPKVDNKHNRGHHLLKNSGIVGANYSKHEYKQGKPNNNQSWIPPKDKEKWSSVADRFSNLDTSAKHTPKNVSDHLREKTRNLSKQQEIESHIDDNVRSNEVVGENYSKQGYKSWHQQDDIEESTCSEKSRNEQVSHDRNSYFQQDSRKDRSGKYNYECNSLQDQRQSYNIKSHQNINDDDDDAWNDYQPSQKNKSATPLSHEVSHNTKECGPARHRPNVIDNFYDRDSRSSKQLQEIEFDKFYANVGNEVVFKKVDETFGDLFCVSNDYSLGHCVAEDMNMGSGIAVEFRYKFKRVDELLEQRQTQGSVAVLDVDKRFVYYLITKRASSGKPTYLTLWNSLQAMKQHIVKHDVHKLALPRIGCGLDGLEWSTVKKMLEYIFQDVDIKITIYNFQQGTDPTPPRTVKKSTVQNYRYPLKDLESGAIIIYLGSEDGYVTDEIKELDQKYRIVNDYRNATRKVGETIRTEKWNMNYLLQGCIIRKNKNDRFSYINFQKCISAIQKQNRKEQFGYVGIQAFSEHEDVRFFMSKLVNLLRNSLTQVEICVCWPKELQSEMPSENQLKLFNY